MKIIVTVIAFLLLAACTKNTETILHSRCGGNICCLKSLDIIEKNSYTIAADNLCPEGKTLNGLNCPGAYKWCQ